MFSSFSSLIVQIKGFFWCQQVLEVLMFFLVKNIPHPRLLHITITYSRVIFLYTFYAFGGWLAERKEFSM